MKKCWIPLSYSQSDTQAMSELFEVFAQKGWHFHKLNSSSAVFIKGEKQSITYTVDLFSQPRNNQDDERVSEYRALCAHSGWEYVDGYNEFQVFKAKYADPVPLQSDDELATEIVYVQQIKRIKSNIVGVLSLIILVIAATFMNPLDPLVDDTFLATLLILPIIAFIYILWNGYQYIRIKKMNENLTCTMNTNKNHLLIKSILSLTVVILFFGSIIIYLGLKFLRREHVQGSLYTVIAFVNMLFVLYYQKRNEGRRLKTSKYIVVFALCFIGGCVVVNVFDDFIPKLAIDQSRIIRMNDPTANGTFTKGSSYFVPYQCEFVSESYGYTYSLYIAKDLKTSELVYNALLAQNKMSKDELEPVNERYAVAGHYLNDSHSMLIFHIDNCVIFIKGNGDALINISRFNEQLSELNLSY